MEGLNGPVPCVPGLGSECRGRFWTWDVRRSICGVLGPVHESIERRQERGLMLVGMVGDLPPAYENVNGYVFPCMCASLDTCRARG